MGGADSGLISYLEKHQDGAKWLIAVSNSQSAGQLILSTGKPVISMFGFTGSDKAMTLAKLKELVKKGELHYIQLGGGMGGGMRGGPGGGNNADSELTAWVQKHGTAVKESAYDKNATSESSSSSSSSNSSNSSNSNSSNSSTTSTVYRLDPSDVS